MTVSELHLIIVTFYMILVTNIKNLLLHRDVNIIYLTCGSACLHKNRTTLCYSTENLTQFSLYFQNYANDIVLNYVVMWNRTKKQKI